VGVEARQQLTLKAHSMGQDSHMRVHEKGAGLKIPIMINLV